MKLEEILVIGAFGFLAVGLYFYLQPKKVEVPFVRPAATNAFVPDPDISEWSYKNAIRQDYEAMVKLETHPYNKQMVGWNVGNINPTWERILQKKYF